MLRNMRRGRRFFNNWAPVGFHIFLHCLMIIVGLESSMFVSRNILAFAARSHPLHAGTQRVSLVHLIKEGKNSRARGLFFEFHSDNGCDAGVVQGALKVEMGSLHRSQGISRGRTGIGGESKAPVRKRRAMMPTAMTNSGCRIIPNEVFRWWRGGVGWRWANLMLATAPKTSSPNYLAN